MRTLLLATLGLYLSLSASAQEADPFDLLFGGGETISAGTEDQAGQDDLNIVRLRLRRFTLNDSVPAYDTAGGLCLPMQPVVEALEFPIELTDDTATGWFLATGNTVEIEFSAGVAKVKDAPIAIMETAFSKTDDGWCATLDTYEQLFGFAFAYERSTLDINLDPDAILPIEARLEREALRKELEREGGNKRPDYEFVQNPYRWLSVPVGDIGIDTTINSAGTAEARLSVELAGDILKTTGRFRSVSRTDDMLDGLRLTLDRANADGDLGLLNARQITLGDVSAPSLPLISRGNNGVGMVISNRSALAADMFDTTEIRGPLPQGWEAELYDAGQLVAFVTEPDSNGDYVFDQVTLRPGFNRFEVRLFGPYGETETRPVSYMIGAELNPENETSYTIGVIDGRQTLFGEALVKAPSLTSEDTLIKIAETKPRAFASLAYGLSDRLTLRVDSESELDAFSALTTSLLFAGDTSYSAVRVAADGQGRSGVQIAHQRRVGERSSLSVSAIDYGALENEITGYDASKLQRGASVRVDTQVPIRNVSLPFQGQLRWAEYANGLTNIDALARVSGALRVYRWTNTLRYSNMSDTTGSVSSLRGEALIARSIRKLRVRSSLAYDLTDGFAPTTGTLGVQRAYKNNSTAQFTAAHDFKSGRTNAQAGWSRQFDKFALSANASVSDQGTWSTGLRLSLALFRDKDRARFDIAAPGLSRSGTIRQHVFHDLNGNGQFDEGEPPIKGVQFIVGNTLRPEKTDASGRVVLSGLPAGSQIDIEFQMSSLDDPFLRPAFIGRKTIVRPGQVVEISTPVQSTGDAEGILLVQNGEYQTPVSGVEVEFVDTSGRVVATSITEFDGYFYTDGLPMGGLSVQVSQAALDATNTVAEPLKLNLNVDEPSVYGLKVIVAPRAKPAS
jgi:hypothetical protein